MSGNKAAYILPASAVDHVLDAIAFEDRFRHTTAGAATAKNNDIVLPSELCQFRWQCIEGDIHGAFYAAFCKFAWCTDINQKAVPDYTIQVVGMTAVKYLLKGSHFVNI